MAKILGGLWSVDFVHQHGKTVCDIAQKLAELHDVPLAILQDAVD